MTHTILSSHFRLSQNSLIDLLTSKGSCFITKKNKELFCKKRKKGFWTTNPFFSGLRMYFYWLWYLIRSDGCLLHLKHVSFGFDIYHCGLKHNGLKHLCSLKLVSILRAKLWKVVMNCKIVMFFNFWGSFSRKFIFEVAKFYLTKYQISNQLNFFSGSL